MLFLTNTTEGGWVGEGRSDEKHEAKAEIQDDKKVVTDKKPNIVESVK